MSNFDGQAEATAIYDLVKALCGGRVHRDIASDDAIEKNSDGSVKPYIHLLFNTPVPAGRGRSLGRETVQPHILSASANVVSNNTVTTDQVAAALVNLCLDWAPPINNAGDLKVSGGSSFTTTDAGGSTQRKTKIVRLESLINLSPVTA